VSFLRSRPRAVPLVLAAVVAAGLGLGAAALAGRSPSAPEVDGASGQVQDRAATPVPSGPATDVPPAAPASEVAPRIAFLGDSLTEGVGAPPERGYAWQTAERLGWPIAVVEGVAGSGFLAPGAGLPMPDRVAAVLAADPDVVVVAGGTNDAFQGFAPADVGAAAGRLLGELRAARPDTTILVLGPFPTTLEAATAADPTSDAVRAAAEAAGADFVDARELVATAVTDPDQWERYISADGLHPNELGYGVMADALAAELRTLVG
jgi:lysophospholipase L1-like esterase